METVSNFILRGSKIIACDCSHEIKRGLLLGRKVITNLDSILKSRDITLPTKVLLVKAMVFPVVMNGCESWTIKKAERQRIDVCKLWCWRRLLRVPWTARRSNQYTLKEISPESSLVRLMLKLILQHFGHLMRRTDSLEKTLMLGKIEGGRRKWRQRMRWLDGITDSMDMIWVNSRSWWWTGRPGVLQSFGSQRVGHDRATELNWTQWLQKGHQTHGRQYGIITLILLGRWSIIIVSTSGAYTVDLQLCIFSLDLSCQQQTRQTHSQISALPLSSSATLANMPWASISCMTHRADVRISMW